MSAALTVLVGLASGVLAGAFGIGGGLLTTPAIRLLLGYPAITAVGTPLPVILPGALTGALAYHRRGSVDVRAGLIAGIAGSGGSVLGAWLSSLVGGGPLLVATAALMGWAAVDMLSQHRSAARERGEAEADPGIAVAPIAHGSGTSARFALVGLAAGVYSGLLGLGGGFVIVPALTRFCGFPVKRAIGTSLLTIAVLAIPGTATHALLGHIDWPLAGLLAIGVVPGAVLGERLIRNAEDRHVRLAFAVFLLLVGVVLAGSELLGGLR